MVTTTITISRDLHGQIERLAVEHALPFEQMFYICLLRGAYIVICDLASGKLTEAEFIAQVKATEVN